MNDYCDVVSRDTIRILRTLPGPAERLWAYLTEPDKRKLWLADGDMNLMIGGRVELVFHNSELAKNDDPPPQKYKHLANEARLVGRVTACEPHFLLSYTWGEGSGDVSEVSFELEPKGDKVMLVITHRRIGAYDTKISVAAGWHTHLDILADQLAGRSPQGFWMRHTALEAEYMNRIPAE